MDVLGNPIDFADAIDPYVTNDRENPKFGHIPGIAEFLPNRPNEENQVNLRREIKDSSKTHVEAANPLYIKEAVNYKIGASKTHF